MWAMTLGCAFFGCVLSHTNLFVISLTVLHGFRGHSLYFALDAMEYKVALQWVALWCRNLNCCIRRAYVPH